LSVAYYSLIFLIAAALILPLAGGEFGTTLQMAAIAVGLMAVAFSVRNTDVQHFSRASARPLWIFILVPLLVAAQMMPMPLWLAHPIWASANEALQTQSFGYVTADLGETLNVLFSAIATIAIVCVTIVVAKDRRRAELILFALSAIAALHALFVLARGILPTTVTRLGFAGDVSPDLSAFGLVLNLAVVQLAIERRETRHVTSRAIIIGLAGLVGAFINGTALYQSGNAGTGAAIGFGLCAFALILIVRRLDLAPLSTIALCAATLVGVLIVVTWLLEKGPSDSALLRLVPAISSDARAALERIIADGHWFGAGAGTFTAIGRIYDPQVSGALVAPSTAVALLVDTGWIGLVGAILASITFLVNLFRGALERGRDSFFPAAAAACLTFTLGEAFVGAGLLQTSVVTVVAVITGLGLSQSVSQTTRQ
jgi:hypothetical protein